MRINDFFAFVFDHFTVQLNSPAGLAEILREAENSMTTMQTALNRYVSHLETNTPEVSLAVLTNSVHGHDYRLKKFRLINNHGQHLF